MISEEEKKAIENIKLELNKPKEYEYRKLLKSEYTIEKPKIYNSKDLHTILNLIQKQQAEIENLKQIKKEPMIDDLKRSKLYEKGGNI